MDMNTSMGSGLDFATFMNSAQTAYLQNYVNSQVAPIQAAVNTLVNRVPNTPQPAYLVNTNTSCGANYAYGNCCGYTGA